MLSYKLYRFMDFFMVIYKYFLFYRVMSDFSDKKESYKNHKFIKILIFIIGFCLIVMNLELGIRTLVYITSSIIMYQVFYKVKFFNNVIISLIYWFGIVTIEHLSVVLFLRDNNLDILYTITNSRAIGIYFTKIILMGIEVKIIKYFKNYLNFSGNGFLLILLYIFSTICTIGALFFMNISINIPEVLNRGLSMIFILLLTTSTISLVFGIIELYKERKDKLRNKIIAQKMISNIKNYESIREIINIERHIYHDLKNHLICIKNLGKKEDIVKYIDNLYNEITDFQKIYDVGNEVADIILSEKSYLCHKNNIDFNVFADLSKLDFIEDIDLCAIFSNALDNAFEACSNINDENIKKRITLKVTYINKLCIVKFTNTKQNKIKKENNLIKSTKKDKIINGVGISSITSIARKYNGDIAINYSDYEFKLKIIIPLK